MKRAPYPTRRDESGKTYWRSLDELAGSPELEESKDREFPESAKEAPKGMERRRFLTVMGASMALSGLVGCRRPEEKILPYARAPEEVIPGRPLFFATTMPFMGTAFGLIVESHEGRPTKIEGNPRHPESMGATTTFLQAVVLDMYDNDRSDSPTEGAGRFQKQSWEAAASMLRKLGGELKAKGGKGFAVLTEGHRSPTLKAGLDELKAAMPEAKVYRYEAFSRDAAQKGAKLAFGKALEPVLDVAKAKRIVALDADILGTEYSPIKQARGFTDGRTGDQVGPEMNRLYAAESTYTVTGAAADHRLRLASRKIPALATALARELATTHKIDLGAEFGEAGNLGEKADKWVKAVAADLAQHKGEGLVVAGLGQPAEVHALVALVNNALGNTGKTVRYVAPFDEAGEGADQIMALVKDIGEGKVDTLLILGGNPVFTAPADAGFEAALSKVKTSIHLSTHRDETSAKTSWHLNRAHLLETWGDARAEDGTASVVQPLIAPLFSGKTDAEVVDLVLGRGRKAYDLVRATWQAQLKGVVDFERAFRRALHDGMWENTAFAAEAVTPQPAEVAKALKDWKAPADGLELTFRADPHAYDGRFANSGWLQELPDSMSKLTWGNAALVSPTKAKELGVVDGDVLSISAAGAQVKVPVLVAPGQADDSIALTFGQGRSHAGSVGNGVGVNTAPLRKSESLGIVGGAAASKSGEKAKLARTQENFLTFDRNVVREATVEEFEKDPHFVKEKEIPHPPLLSLWKEHSYPGAAWGMNIDLNACIGCNACVAACVSENNIPVVGADGVSRSREMHWIRVDRYFEGKDMDEPRAVSQPTMCNHCENAPCEQVCPVGATTHSPEGLNDMAYNRCVGTRYCANNCPFKVRKFNFFNYSKQITELGKMQINPDVTVRSRGVMEKCTFCVQRINHAKIDAKREGRERLRDGEVVSACQQACPTQAITFGDLNDAGSKVAAKASNPRAYKLLEELNVKPRVSYLAKIRNPNPALENA